MSNLVLAFVLAVRRGTRPMDADGIHLATANAGILLMVSSMARDASLKVKRCNVQHGGEEQACFWVQVAAKHHDISFKRSQLKHACAQVPASPRRKNARR